MIIQLDTAPPQEWIASGTVADGSGEDDVFHVRFDPEHDSVVQVVVRSVGTIRNVDPLELAPLEEAVDTETIERVAGPEADEASRHGEITFRYEGLRVTVETDGHVWLEWE